MAEKRIALAGNHKGKTKFALGGQVGRRQIADIAQFSHGALHFVDRFYGHSAARIDHAICCRIADPGFASHIG